MRKAVQRRNSAQKTINEKAGTAKIPWGEGSTFRGKKALVLQKKNEEAEGEERTQKGKEQKRNTRSRREKGKTSQPKKKRLAKTRCVGNCVMRRRCPKNRDRKRPKQKKENTEDE